MAQMLHNTFKAFRPSDSQRLGLAGSVICADALKSYERYETTGAGGLSMREVDE